MKKMLGLMGLVASLGCTQLEVSRPSHPVLNTMVPGDYATTRMESNTLFMTYAGPEDKSADTADDDVLFIREETLARFNDIETIRLHSSGRFYANGFLFDYSIENDNDGDATNNVLRFSMRTW